MEEMVRFYGIFTTWGAYDFFYYFFYGLAQLRALGARFMPLLGAPQEVAEEGRQGV